MAKFTWQQEEDFLKAAFTFRIEDAIDWIQRNLSPEDVFNEKDLDRWAENNKYLKE